MDKIGLFKVQQRQLTGRWCILADFLHPADRQVELLRQLLGIVAGELLADQPVARRAGQGVHLRDVKVGAAVLRRQRQQRLDARDLRQLPV